jgi:3-oxoacyl-[acyl-carrier-protein] synthase III
MKRDVMVRGLRYELGEIERDYTEAPGFGAVVQRERMVLKPDLWGWGKYRQTADPYTLVCASAEKSLSAAGALPSDVDLMVICTSAFDSAGHDLYEKVFTALKPLGLRDCVVMGLTLMGCASALAGVSLAADLVASGRHRQGLVVAFDKLNEGADRFLRFGIMSDAAVSCIVSTELGAGYQFVASLQASDPRQILADADFDPKREMTRGVYQRLERDFGVELARVEKMFSHNVFTPVKVIKERLLGFQRKQMFMDNVPRIGHCFSCDSLINLADYEASGAEVERARFVLQADAYGQCAIVVLDALPRNGAGAASSAAAG